MIEDERDVVTEISFELNGSFDDVCAVLEELQDVVSSVNQGDKVKVIVDVSTRNPYVEHEGHKYDEDATIRRWEELEQSPIDLDALVHLNRTQKMVEEDNVATDTLNKRISFFAKQLFPNTMNEAIPILQQEVDNIEEISYTESENIGDIAYPQHLILGTLDIKLSDNDDEDPEQNNTKKKVVETIQTVFAVKGIPENFIKNVQINFRK